VDKETEKRIERKIDYIACLVMSAIGVGAGLLIVTSETWGVWSTVFGSIIMLLFPAYLISKYRDIL